MAGYFLGFDGAHPGLWVDSPNDFLAVQRGYEELLALAYPPERGGDMSTFCEVWRYEGGAGVFVCNVNARGDIDFIQ